MAENEAEIKLRAQVDGLKKDLDKAQKQIKGFGSKATSSFKGIGKAIGQAFAAQQIGQFITQGIKDFAAMERSLDNLGRKLEGLGHQWKDLEGGVKDYLSAVQESTRFGDDEALASFDRLVSITQDYNAALALNEKAMDLAVFANIPLEQAAQNLALAYEGNTTGLGFLARELGLTTEESKDQETVFAILSERTDGLARSEDTLATKMTQAKNAMADAGKLIGEKLAPALLLIANFFKDKLPKAIDIVVRSAETMGAFFGNVILTLKNDLDDMVQKFKNFGTFLKNVWKGPRKAYADFTKANADSTKKWIQQETIRREAFSDTMEDIWKKDAETKNEIDVDAAKKNFKLKKKNLTDTIRLGKSEVEHYADNMRRTSTLFNGLFQGLTKTREVYIQEAGESIEAFNERIRQGEQVLADHAAAVMEQITTLATGASQTLAGEWSLFMQGMIEGTLDIEDAFERMGKAMVKFVLSAIGDALIAEGASYIARGIAALLGVITAPMGPGLMAAGAKLSIAGGLVKGVAAAIKLGEGALVTGPTSAIIGEKGPELVIPLDKVPAMGGLTMTGTRIQMNFPGIRSARDVDTPRFGQSVERQLATSLQNLRQRQGQKVSTGI